jgi:hypothetical protein
MDQEFRQIQLGVDSIIGTRSIIRRRKKSTSDKKRELFFSMINSIEELNIRQNIMYADLSIDFSNYDEKFFTVIDTLLYMNFGKQCVDLIAFYLYERLNSDGTMNHILTEDEQEIFLETPYDLWNLMCQVNPKLNE